MAKNRLYKRRKELGLTLEEVGKIVGVSKSTVGKWETGYIENMKRDKIDLLAQALKTTPLFVMGVDEDSNYETEKTTDVKKILDEEDNVTYNGKPISSENKEKIKKLLELILADENIH